MTAPSQRHSIVEVSPYHDRTGVKDTVSNVPETSRAREDGAIH